MVGRGGPQGKNGGTAMFPSGFSWRTAAHELGHAFGLDHDFRDDAYMMSYGSHRNRLSAGSAGYLTVHPYFNSGTPSSTGTGAQDKMPTIELMSSTGYPVGSNRVSIQLKVSDTEGLHQVILFVSTPDPHPAAGFREVKMYRALGGEKDAVIEFEYDGVIPSLGYTSLSDPPAHPMYVTVVDTDGNVRDQFLSLLEISPYHIATLEGHTRKVGSIAFSPDGTIFASGSDDGTVGLWDVATRTNITTLEVAVREPYRFPVLSLPFPPMVRRSLHSQTITKSNYGIFRQGKISLPSRYLIFILFSLSPDGTLLAASVALDGTARIDDTLSLWDVSTGENIATLEGHGDLVWSVAFSPDGTLLASGSMDKMVKLWDVATGENLATFEGH